MIKKIATAAAYAEEPQKALDFRTKPVGFEIHAQKSMRPHASWVEVGPSAAASCLVIYPKSMMADWAERKPPIVFECEDLQKTYEEMRGRGVIFSQAPKEMPWGPSPFSQISTATRSG